MDELEQGQQELRDDVNKTKGQLTKIFELLQERNVGGTSSRANQKQQAPRSNFLGFTPMSVRSFGQNPQEMMVPLAVCPYNLPQPTFQTSFPSHPYTAITPNIPHPQPYRSIMPYHPPSPIHSQHTLQTPHMPYSYASVPSQGLPPHPYNPTALYFPPRPTPPRTLFTISAQLNQSQIHIPNLNPNQQKQRKKHVQPDPIPMSYTELFPYLIHGSLVVPHPLPPVEPPYPRGYDPNAKCDYHAGAIGHSTENCRALKYKVQDLIIPIMCLIMGVLLIMLQRS